MPDPTTGREDPVTIVVARDGDLVRIEPSGAPPDRIDTASLPVAGGILIVDATGHAGALPQAVLDDPYWAQAWLAGVYGAPVAAAVALFEDESFTTPQQVTGPPGPLARIVHRLGTGTWLHRWWPSGAAGIVELDEWLLELELGTLAWQAQACFLDTGPIAALLAPHAGLLATQVEQLRRTGSGPADWHALEVLVDALRATVDLVDDQVDGYGACAALVDRLDAEESDYAAARGHGTVDDFLASLPAPPGAAQGQGRGRRAFRRRPGAAVTSTLLTGIATVDWAQVPPRTVLAVDDNLQWSVVRDLVGEVAVRVRVDASPFFADPGVLYARIFGPDGVPTVFALQHDRTESVYVGSRRLDAAPASLQVDVFGSQHVHRPRLSEAALVLARAERARVVVVIDSRRHPAWGTEPQFLAETTSWARQHG